MKHKKPRVIVSVSNDLFSDQRVDKVCNSLLDMGFEVLLVGRRLPTSLPVSSRRYQTKRMFLVFKKGALFYAELNFRLFWFLLFRRSSVLLANDLDTLLPNYVVSKIKRKHLVYDSHEYFTEVPELKEGSFAKNTWLKIERWIFPKLKHVYTVNESIASIYREKYKVDIQVVRNISKKRQVVKHRSRKELGIDEDKKIILLQGAGINIDRGAEELVRSMQYLNNDFQLLIIGGGDVFDILKMDIKELDLYEKVKILGKKPYEELCQFTQISDLGISMDKDTNPNYRFSLPNKIFDYIHSGVPVLISDLVEIKRVVEYYDVGWVISTHDPQQIAQKINSIFEDKDVYLQKKENTKKASKELNWENEEKVLEKVYLPLLK